MTSQVYEPKGYRFTYVPAAEFDDNLAVASRRGREARLGRDPVEPAAEHRRHPQGRRRRPRRRRAARRRQHVRHAVPPAAARARRRRSSSTRRRSTSAATATRSAASSRRTTTRSPSASTSCRSRSAPSPARSMRGSCCAGSRRSRYACGSIARTRGGSPSSSTGTRRVERVLYPGLPTHPGHDVARTSDARLRRHGLVPSSSPRQEAVDFVARTKLFQLAESLGGVESLIEHPARMTHASTADRAVRAAREPRPPVGGNRVGRRPARRSRGRPCQTVDAGARLAGGAGSSGTSLHRSSPNRSSARGNRRSACISTV